MNDLPVTAINKPTNATVAVLTSSCHLGTHVCTYDSLGSSLLFSLFGGLGIYCSKVGGSSFS